MYNLCDIWQVRLRDCKARVVCYDLSLNCTLYLSYFKLDTNHKHHIIPVAGILDVWYSAQGSFLLGDGFSRTRVSFQHAHAETLSYRDATSA